MDPEIQISHFHLYVENIFLKLLKYKVCMWKKEEN